jgi:AcrR family transcriptional regulator
VSGTYRLQRRAERQAKTREQIVTAAVALHTTVGPARTTDIAVARKAGVTRMTFYRHFPTGLALFEACQLHGLQRWPPPDAAHWRRITDPEARLRIALSELYAYYHTAGPGLAVIVRDAPLLPPEVLAFPSRLDSFRAMPPVLMVGWGVRGRRRRLLEAAINHVISVQVWQSLVQRERLSEDDAVELLLSMVRAAVGT